MLDRAVDTPRRYLAVFRASSAVRLPLDDQVVLNFTEDTGTTEVIVRSLWVQEGELGVVPREIWIQVIGYGQSLDEAAPRIRNRATSVASDLSLVSNAAIDELQMELMFDITEGAIEHESLQIFLLDETGLPRIARWLPKDGLIELFAALDKRPDNEIDRLQRAIGQYEAALRHCFPGHELMALAHLWMAMEALTPLARQREFDRLGPDCAADELATEWGIEKRQVDSQVRKRILFDGDDHLYAAAKRASDGFEHGFEKMEVVRKIAVAEYGDLASKVRRRIFELAGLDPAVLQTLTAEMYETTLPCVRFQKQLRLTLNGTVNELAGGDFGYPMHRLISTIAKIEGADITPNEEFTSHLPKGVTVTNARYTMYGPKGFDNFAQADARKLGDPTPPEDGAVDLNPEPSATPTIS